MYFSENPSWEQETFVYGTFSTTSSLKRGIMNISIKISPNICTDYIQVEDSSPVNLSADVLLTGFIVLSVVLILGVNSTIIKWVEP